MNYSMKTQQKIANQYEIELKSKLYDLQKKLATRTGFLKYYYKILPRCKTLTSAFEITNLMYYKLFDEYCFTSYHSFCMFRKKTLKKWV